MMMQKITPKERKTGLEVKDSKPVFVSVRKKYDPSNAFTDCPHSVSDFFRYAIGERCVCFLKQVEKYRLS